MTTTTAPQLLAVNVSPGGIPKLPLAAGEVTKEGLVGDGRNHAKHIRPDRAISLFDWEILQQLVGEGFPLVPGAAGENLTVSGLHVQDLPPGTLLQIGDVTLRLEQPRKPCYVLDAIDPRLKEAIVGRCGYMASVVQEGTLLPQMRISVRNDAAGSIKRGPVPSGTPVRRFEMAAPGQRPRELFQQAST